MQTCTEQSNGQTQIMDKIQFRSSFNKKLITFSLGARGHIQCTYACKGDGWSS